MAILSAGSIDKIWAQFMRKYSKRRDEIPVSKNQLRTFIEIVDAEMEAAETSIVQAVPAGAIRDWVIANAAVGRDVIGMVEDERRETL